MGLQSKIFVTEHGLCKIGIKFYVGWPLTTLRYKLRLISVTSNLIKIGTG